MHQVQRRFKCTGNIIFFVSVSIRAYLLVSVTIFYSGYRQIETLVYISKILIVRVSRTCLNFTIAMNYFIELNLSSPNILCPPMWNLLIGYAYTLCWMIVYFMFCRKIWYWSILVNATFTNVCCLIGVCVCVRKREGAERERVCLCGNVCVYVYMCLCVCTCVNACILMCVCVCIINYIIFTRIKGKYVGFKLWYKASMFGGGLLRLYRSWIYENLNKTGRNLNSERKDGQNAPKDFIRQTEESAADYIIRTICSFELVYE